MESSIKLSVQFAVTCKDSYLNAEFYYYARGTERMQMRVSDFSMNPRYSLISMSCTKLFSVSRKVANIIPPDSMGGR